jgi:tellurite resistance protein TerC
MSFLFAEAMGTPIWIWTGFIIFVLGLMAFDLGILYRRPHVVSMRESLQLWGFYVSLALGFGVVLWFWRGAETAFLYLTGYVVEQSLSLDNVFVIAVILSYFGVPRHLQHRVLFYGILGVIVLRGVMIVAGAALIAKFHWVLYLFAAFLVFTGIKMLMNGDAEYDVENNPVLKFMRRRFRITDDFRGQRFIVREPDPKTGVVYTYITPLFVALCVIEVADVIFAVDSIPAIFAITTDPFIIFTSNIFAILGLRAMFFALSALIHRFAYLKYALSVVLVFIGSKILITEAFGIGPMPPGWSLSITLAILGSGVGLSMWSTARQLRALRRNPSAVPHAGQNAGPHGGQQTGNQPNA